EHHDVAVAARMPAVGALCEVAHGLEARPMNLGQVDADLVLARSEVLEDERRAELQSAVAAGHSFDLVAESIRAASAHEEQGPDPARSVSGQVDRVVPRAAEHAGRAPPLRAARGDRVVSGKADDRSQRLPLVVQDVGAVGSAEQDVVLRISRAVVGDGSQSGSVPPAHPVSGSPGLAVHAAATARVSAARASAAGGTTRALRIARVVTGVLSLV